MAFHLIHSLRGLSGVTHSKYLVNSEVQQGNGVFPGTSTLRILADKCPLVFIWAHRAHI